MANCILTQQMIEREAVQLFRNSNKFLEDMEWEKSFAQLPDPTIDFASLAVPLPLMAAVGAAAIVVKNPVVSRRFWDGWFS